ncbi:hypothetical protein Tco_0023616 [Tanacetum coccineum]
MKFQIDLIPGAAPVARAPYRLAPSEMKELSDQLKELSNKGFIRPSSLPWGAPITYPILGSYRFISPSVELTQKASLFEEGTPRLYKPSTNPILGRCGIVTIPHPLKNQRPRWSQLCWSWLAPLFGSKPPLHRPPLRARWSWICCSRLAPSLSPSHHSIGHHSEC